MVLDVSLHTGPHRGPASGIAAREQHSSHGDSALWEITLTLAIRAPEQWWKQAQRYFPEIAWFRARPELAEDERRLVPEDFEEPVPSGVIDHLNALLDAGNREALRLQLPDSFIRHGLAHTTMEVLARISRERGHYNAGHWKAFVEQLHELPEVGEIFSVATRPADA
ncbi:MAG: hypothetical protein PF508_03140 [Spirochaeta sp.]|jgi:hypothetical protein|nr:hypothetical protein [Spirochaeta sp.]